MTVKELIKELKNYPPDLRVVRVVDFENVDEFGNSESEEIGGMTKQIFPDTQFGDNDDEELMLY